MLVPESTDAKVDDMVTSDVSSARRIIRDDKWD
jgi:hypothetical protein